MPFKKLYPSILVLAAAYLNATPTPDDHSKAAENPDYYVHVTLTGVVKQLIFPGPPNFLSVEDGDWAEPRTILEIDKDSLQRLVKAQSGVTSNHYMGGFIDSQLREDEPDANLVTLDSSFTEEPDHIEAYTDKIVTLDTVLSAQPAHCHTAFVVEVAKVLSHE